MKTGRKRQAEIIWQHTHFASQRSLTAERPVPQITETSTIQIQRFSATIKAALRAIGCFILCPMVLFLSSQLIFANALTQIDHEQRSLHYQHQSFSNGSIRRLLLVSVLHKADRPHSEVEDLPVETKLLETETQNKPVETNLTEAYSRDGGQLV